ncbi:MAG: Spy/CpxP family protein refolding chaperone [Burkholderiales bacterium]|nr:Spy/CpxP family protein refolding chaperone [Burkholderiales bacterium]
MKRLMIIPAIAALLSASVAIAAPDRPETHAVKSAEHHAQHHGERWAKLKADLKLNDAQDLAWQQIADKSAALHKERRADRKQFSEALKQELAKPEPDFGRVAQLRQQMEEKGLQARNEIRDMQLGFYTSLNLEQKAIIKDALQGHIARMEKWREKKHSAS